MAYDRDVSVLSRDYEGMVEFRMPYAHQEFTQTVLARFIGSRQYAGSVQVLIRDADAALELCRSYFPSVSDQRTSGKTPAPLWTEGPTLNIFGRLDTLADMQEARRPLSGNMSYHDRVGQDQMHVLHQKRGSELLRILGWFTIEPGYGDERPKWQQFSGAAEFFQRMLRDFGEAIIAETRPDMSMRETLTKLSMRDLFTSVRGKALGVPPLSVGEKFYPPLEHAPYWIAAAIACIGGPDYQSDDDQEAFWRDLPAWPMKIATIPEEMTVMGARQNILSWCALPVQKWNNNGVGLLLHISAVGPMMKLTALWAYILDGSKGTLQLTKPNTSGSYNRVQTTACARESGSQRYKRHFNAKTLPNSGMAHMALTHVSAFQTEPGMAGFLHIVGNNVGCGPNLDLLYQQLDRALLVPVRREWMAKLWEWGLEYGVIIPAESFGCTGYWVTTPEKMWSQLVAAMELGLEHPKKMTSAMFQVETVGKAIVESLIVEKAAEEDADLEDED